MDTTTNLGLKKPELSERYSLAVWNGNSDTLDEYAGTVNTALAGKATTADITTAIAALDVSSKGGTGKYISAIEETDGKISATATSLASAPESGGTAAISSGAVYTALADKATTADITAAIAALDVSSKGGSGKYISAISEADGKISATATSLATEPTSGGSAAITSGAVYDAVSDKITTAQAVAAIYGLGTNIAIGDDLNSDTYKVPGTYYTSTTERCAGAINRPDFADANKKVFRLEVKTMNSATRLIHELTTFMATTTGAEPQGYVERFIRAFTSGGWGSWYQMNTTAVNTYAPASLNSINPAQLQVMPPDGEESEDR